MVERKKDHHFIPQSYLRRWASEEGKIWTYRILVPDDRIPEWKAQSTRGIAYHQDLYTRRDGGIDTAALEDWLNEEIEAPSVGPLEKIVAQEELSADEWSRVARFLGAQDLRTPTSYLEMKARWEQELPDLMDSVLKSVVQDLEAGKHREPSPKSYDNPTGIFNVQIEEPESREDDVGHIRAEVTIGRALWLENVKWLLNGTARVLETHHWSVVEPFGDMEWFTSDHPVVRLNYYGPDNYDLRGGWGNPGGELLMPVSPRCLLYTQIGTQHARRFQFTREQTFFVQKVLAERAFRMVFARKKTRKVRWFRPRVVDRQRFLHEQYQRRNWNQEQGVAEADA